MRSGSDNFIYELLNYEDDNHYSLNAISKIEVQRINNSDLLKLSYTVNDPGICQQTLAIYNSVCTVNYKHIKENTIYVSQKTDIDTGIIYNILKCNNNKSLMLKIYVATTTGTMLVSNLP